MSDFAMKRAMQKRMAKGAGECMACKGGQCMEHGGEVGHNALENAKKMKEEHMRNGMLRKNYGVESKGEFDKAEHHQKNVNRLSEAKKMNYAEGGDVMGDDDLVMRIMKKRYSEGGEVANDVSPIADEMPAQYDELVKDDDLEFHDTGANSGDEIGDDQEEDDRKDIVSRVMKSRSKKDRMPRPA